MSETTQARPDAVAGQVDRGVRPVAEVCAGSLRWHIPMPDHVPKAEWLSGVHYLYDQAALEAERERGLIALREWAVSRWRAEVEQRPLANKHRRSLDDCWRQVMRYAGLDPDEAVGPSHDALLAAGSAEMARRDALGPWEDRA